VFTITKWYRLVGENQMVHAKISSTNEFLDII
jgi:hypothetical protein